MTSQKTIYDLAVGGGLVGIDTTITGIKMGSTTLLIEKGGIDL